MRENREKKKQQVPGHNYFKKLDDISRTCITSGEMFHEYRADQSVSPTPRPLPDTSKLPKFHYLPVKDTPTLDKEGIQREADNVEESLVKGELWSQTRHISKERHEIPV